MLQFIKMTRVKRKENFIFTRIVFKCGKIEYFDEYVYVRYDRIFYIILDYGKQKMEPR